MITGPVPDDTDPSSQAALVGAWRSMSTEQRITLVGQLCEDVDRLARAGITHRHPDWDEDRIRLELIRRRYGRETAERFERSLVGR